MSSPSSPPTHGIAIGVPASKLQKQKKILNLCLLATMGCLVVGGGFGLYAGIAGQVWLMEDEQVLLTGPINKYVEHGPGVIRFNPFEYGQEIRKGLQLTELEYVRVTNKLTGLITTVQGPQLYFPGAWDEASEPLHAIQLLRHQYLKLVDGPTGKVRVVKGEQLVFPEAMETLKQDVAEAVHVDDDTAALVLDKETGQQRLVTEPGLFFPGAYEEVLEDRQLILVEPHEVAITRNVQGSYTFYNGSANGHGTSFFLQPHDELVTMSWSSDTGGPPIQVLKVDLRSQYASFEYDVRTSDNVELVLQGIIFWEIVDVPKMIERTGDVKGDVWHHARSMLIQAVASATLEQFMAGFNDLVAGAAAMDAEFYSDRGTVLHTLEVTSYTCKDPRQSDVLQEIIQETTNRINSLQKQRSVNEVESEKLKAELELEVARQGLVQAKTDNDRVQMLAEQRAANEVDLEKINNEIALEQSRKQLLSIKAENDRVNATSLGEAEGLKRSRSVLSFFSTLNETMDDPTTLAMYKFLSEQSALTEQLHSTSKNLGSGSASLFLTPADMNLRLHVPTSQSAVTPTGGVEDYSYAPPQVE